MLGLATATPCQVRLDARCGASARLGTAGAGSGLLLGGLLRPWGGADDEDGARRVVLDPLGGAADEDRIADPASAGCHHDQPGVVLVRGLDDLRGGRPTADLLVDPRPP